MQNNMDTNVDARIWISPYCCISAIRETFLAPHLKLLDSLFHCDELLVSAKYKQEWGGQSSHHSEIVDGSETSSSDLRTLLLTRTLALTHKRRTWSFFETSAMLSSPSPRFNTSLIFYCVGVGVGVLVGVGVV